MLCLWLCILGGVDVRFTQEPSDPSYFNNGSDASLVWDYTDPHDKLQYIIYSALVDDTFVRMMVNDSHGVQEHPNIPPSYKGRVEIQGRATLVIKNINPGDNTEFKCEMRGRFPGSVESRVQLVVAGMYFRTKIKSIQLMSLIFLRSGESITVACILLRFSIIVDYSLSMKTSLLTLIPWKVICLIFSYSG